MGSGWSTASRSLYLRYSYGWRSMPRGHDLPEVRRRRILARVASIIDRVDGARDIAGRSAGYAMTSTTHTSGPMRIIESHYRLEQLQTATPGRRLGGFLLDSILFWLTLVVGWIVWSAIVAERGQTPGKQLLGMYVMREDGSRAGGWYTILREWVVYGLLFAGLLGAFTSGLSVVVGGLWCLWDRERQCLWDKVSSTYVAHSPQGFRPLTAAELRLRGLPAATPSQALRPNSPTVISSADRQPNNRTVAERLRELQSLRDQGLLTEELYEERRARMMDEL